MRWVNVKKAIPLLLILFIIPLAFSSAKAIGIGAGGDVFLEDVLRGGFATGQVYVTNPNSYPITVGAWKTGDTGDWITFDPEPRWVLQPGERLDIQATIRPPIFVPNGVYTGHITFIILSIGETTTQGSGSAVAVGSAINVVIEVSDEEVSSLEVYKVNAERTEECRPINIKVTTQNLGNVEGTPTYEVSLYHETKGFVKKETFEEDAIRPTLQREDTLALDYTTTGLSQTWQQFICIPSGDYYAYVVAKDQTGTTFYNDKIDVYILDKGSISSSGNLRDLINKPKARIGEPVKVTGVFDNKGDSTEKATLKLEVYKGDRLVEIVNGEETLANPGQTTDVVAYFTPKELGEFKLYGSVNFGGKFTNVIESSLIAELGITIIILIVAIPLILLILIILLWLRKRRGY